MIHLTLNNGNKSVLTHGSDNESIARIPTQGYIYEYIYHPLHYSPLNYWKGFYSLFFNSPFTSWNLEYNKNTTSNKMVRSKNNKPQLLSSSRNTNNNIHENNNNNNNYDNDDNFIYHNNMTRNNDNDDVLAVDALQQQQQ